MKVLEIIIVAILGLFVAGVIVKAVIDKKKGKPSCDCCDGNCACCHHAKKNK